MKGLRGVGLALAAGVAAILGCALIALIVHGTHAPPASGRPTPTATSSPATLPVGPGPQKVYTVQPQPPAGACHTRGDGTYPLPDPVCTPGAISPAVTQANVHQTVCVKGYTASIRPPLAVTEREKHANAKAYSYTGSFVGTEYDHLVPLSLGGDPNDARNLWIEPNDIPSAKTYVNGKDGVESAAYKAVCAGRLQLAAAQWQMATDWVQLGRQLGVVK